jgi:hypothetical protein
LIEGIPKPFNKSESKTKYFSSINPALTAIYVSTFIPAATAFPCEILKSLILSSACPTVCPKLSTCLRPESY